MFGASHVAQRPLADWDSILDALYARIPQDIVHARPAHVPRYDFVDHPALIHIPDSCDRYRTHALRDLGLYAFVCGSQSIYRPVAQTIFNLHAHFRGPDAPAPFASTVALRLAVKPFCLLDEHLAAAAALMPALSHLLLEIPTGGSETRTPEDYMSALRGLDAFLRSTAGQQLETLAVIMAPCALSGSASRMLCSFFDRPPLPLHNRLKVLDFQPMLNLDAIGQQLGIKTLILLPPGTGLRSITLSLTDFAIVNPRCWDEQPSLKRVSITGPWPHGRFTFAAHLDIGSGLLALSLSNAAHAWQQTLTVLQLYGFTFDERVAQAISDLALLSHLDLFPCKLETQRAQLMLDYEHPNLLDSADKMDVAQWHRDQGLPPARRVILLPPSFMGADALPPVERAGLNASDWDGIFLLLRLCLPSLSSLAVLHLGLYYAGRKQLVAGAAGAAQLGLICPSIKLAGFGACCGSSESQHVHLASSCRCAALAGKHGEALVDPACAVELRGICKPCQAAFFVSTVR